jgi:hypothetical protein
LLLKIIYYMVFKYLDFEPTWWRFFQKHVVCTEFDVYVFITCHNTFS